VDREGLVSALRSLAHHTAASYDVVCKFECDKPLSVENNLLATHVYRIAQEAVNNAVKHAAPKHVIIRLEVTAGELQLSVMDGGGGIRPTTSVGYGMSGMNCRAELIGGRLTVEPRPEGGTLVRCTAPVNNRGDHMAAR